MDEYDTVDYESGAYAMEVGAAENYGELYDPREDEEQPTDGRDDEYLPEDYDTVHCRHGNFIGYPGGADFMCGPCEMGED